MIARQRRAVFEAGGTLNPSCMRASTAGALVRQRFGVEVKRLDTDALVAAPRAQKLAPVPAEDLRVVALGPYECALVTHHGMGALLARR